MYGHSYDGRWIGNCTHKWLQIHSYYRRWIGNRTQAFEWFRPPSATVASAEPFSHGTGTLRCLQKEMATYRHWSVSLRRDPDNVSPYRILSPDKTEWRLISSTLCGWTRFFVADLLWLMTCIREEEGVSPEQRDKQSVFKIFSLSGSHTILVFQYQILWHYSDGDLTGAPNAGGVGADRTSRQISGYRIDDYCSAIKIHGRRCSSV